MPSPLTSSREQLATGHDKAPPHCHGDQRRQGTIVSALRLMMLRRLVIVVRSGSTNSARRPCHCRPQGSTNGTEMLGHQQSLPCAKEEGRASHPLRKMRSVPNEALNKRTRAVHNGGVRRQRVWLVTAARGVRRGDEHNN